MKIIFVCVNFNGSAFTEKFLQSLRDLDGNGRDFTVSCIVVDNASNSSDFSSLQKIVSASGGVNLIRSEKNLGYFGGLNLGLSSFDKSEFDYVVVGNNDLEISPDFVRELSGRVYGSDVLVVAPNVITADGYNQNPHCIGRVSTARKLLYSIYFKNYKFACILSWGAGILKKLKGGRRNDAASRSGYIHMGIGACYILSRKFLEHYEKLDDSVFLYGEEALLAGQVMAVQGRTYYDHRLVVHHAESATLSRLPSRTTYEFGRESYPKYRSYL